MANETLTLKLRLTADFQTIQAIRRLLNERHPHTGLVSQLQAVVENFLRRRTPGEFALSAALRVSPVSETRRVTCPPPLLTDGHLIIWDHELGRQIEAIAVDGPHWPDFLSRHHETSFRYQHPTGFFTAIRENRRGRQVWYAHRRRGGQLKRFYLGTAHTLSSAKLADVAQKMSRWVQESLTAA